MNGSSLGNSEKIMFDELDDWKKTLTWLISSIIQKCWFFYNICFSNIGLLLKTCWIIKKN